MFSYKNFNHLLKTTPRTSYYMLSEDNMRTNLHNREQYLSRTISTPIPPLQNNCVNTYNLNTPNANILALCTEKIPTVPTTVQKVSLNKTKYISNISQFDATTRKPYTQYFGLSTRNTYMYNLFHPTTVPNSINISHIYFTIGDAITTPRTLNNSQFKLFKKHETENHGNQSIINYKMYRSHNTTPVIWAMNSNPISYSQFSNNTAKYSISDNETKNKSKYLYAYENSSVDTTKAMSNNCSNMLLEINNSCASKDKQNLKGFISKISLQTTMDTLGSYPIKTTLDLGTISGSITELPYLGNTSTTAIWNAIEISNNSNGKAPILDNTSSYPPIYRRGKFIQINKRLVFKESLKNKNRNFKTTLPAPIRPLKLKTRENGKYTSSTHFPSSQTTSTQIKEQELLHDNVTDSNVKKAKNKFQGRNRFRWSPSYEKRVSKLNNNISTGSTLVTILSSSTQVTHQRNKKTNKFTRSKVSRHNKRTNIVQMNTTNSVINLHLQSTTPLVSSTPESAIMRISNISGVKMFFTKNNITNSLDNLPNSSNAFIAELPIVTYFKEVTESRKV